MIRRHKKIRNIRYTRECIFSSIDDFSFVENYVQVCKLMQFNKNEYLMRNYGERESSEAKTVRNETKTEMRCK